MSDKNDVENNILYDLLVCIEWPEERENLNRSKEKSRQVFVSRLWTVTERVLLGVLKATGFYSTSGLPYWVPSSLMRHVTSHLNWHVAVAEEGKLLAILQNQSIEVCFLDKDEAETVSRWNIPKDSCPQMRQLVWSSEGDYLAYADSLGNITVYDTVGKLICALQSGYGIASNLVQDLSYAICALIFKDVKKNSDRSVELLVINYRGLLKAYDISSSGEWKLSHTFDFSVYHPDGITTVAYYLNLSMLIIGGSTDTNHRITNSSALHHGISAWRILSDMPYYKLVDFDDDSLVLTNKYNMLRTMKAWLPNPRHSKQNNSFLRLVVSPDGQHLAALDSFGQLTVYRLPSLRVVHSWLHVEQPDHAAVNQNKLVKLKKKKIVPENALLTNVEWWSSKELILSRANGAVLVCSIDNLRNLLGSSAEWFKPLPIINRAHNSAFLVLECESHIKLPRSLRSRSINDQTNETISSQANEDSGESDDEDEASLLKKCTNKAKELIYYTLDMEDPAAQRRALRQLVRKYSLVQLKQITPQQLFMRRIENEEYGEALTLANLYSLDSDLVYQRQWRKSSVTMASIHDYLSKITKRSWVLHECLERVPDNIDAMRELLQYGLRGTELEVLVAIGKHMDSGRFIVSDDLIENKDINDSEVFGDEDDEEGVKEKKKHEELLKEIDSSKLTVIQLDLIRTRIKLLQYLDRLQTYEEILGGVHVAEEKYIGSYFKKFRSQNIVEIVTDFTKAGDWKAVDILFTYHGNELLSHWLALLSTIPETYSPFDYRSLLPEIGSQPNGGDGIMEWECESWREEDWSQHFMSQLDINQSDSGEFLYEENPALSSFRGYPPSKEQVEQWYDYRAHEIEGLSRHVDHALELIRLALERHFEGLDILYDNLITLEMMVYECNIDDGFTLLHLQQMPNIDRLRLIMSKSSDEMYVKNLHRWLVPFLQQCERHEPGSAKELLHDYMISMAQDDLFRCRLICENSHLKVSSPIIKNQADLMSLALDCVYICKSEDQLSNATAILECLPERDNHDAEELALLHDRVDELSDLISVADMLTKYDVHVPIGQIRDKQKNAVEVKKLYVKVTRLASKKEPLLTDKQWMELLSDLLKARDKVFHCIEKSLCTEILVEGLLCSGKFHGIQLAGTLIQCRADESNTFSKNHLSYPKSVELVLAAAREYFDSAATMADAAMDFARLCLNLITDNNKDIEEEVDLIDGLALLESFGVNILPLQVRMCKDRLELVAKALETKSNAYKNISKLLKLGHKLRIGGKGGQKEEEGKILRLVAQAAMKAKDMRTSVETCNQLMQLGYGPAWPECKTLSEFELTEVPLKSKLLDFVLTYCSADILSSVLSSRNLLETQLLYEQVHHVFSERQPSPDQESSHTSKMADSAADSLAFRAKSEQLAVNSKAVLLSTSKATRAVLSHVSDASWWKKTISKLHGSHDTTDGTRNLNAGLEFQACHPFYEEILPQCFVDKRAIDYEELSQNSFDTHAQWAGNFEEKVLRLAQLENAVNKDHSSHVNSEEVLQQLAELNLPYDTALGLGYLLALDKPEIVDHFFLKLPKTSITLQLAAYYYALRLAPHLSSGSTLVDVARAIYEQPPQNLIVYVCKMLDKNQGQISNSAIIEKLRNSANKLTDHVLLEKLKSLASSTDIKRFTDDSQYRLETILGLAMSDEAATFQLTLDLAKRYNVALWDVYLNHLTFLFDSGLPQAEIETRISQRDLLTTLTSRPDDFYQQMQKSVYPLLSGINHTQLFFYYNLFDKCDINEVKEHRKLLKTITNSLPGIDYKMLVSGLGDPIDLLQPLISASNITAVAKVAQKIPTKGGGYLQASTVYCAWAIQQFWVGKKKQSQSDDHWVHYFESVSDSLRKLTPNDYCSFVEKILFSEEATSELTVGNRLKLLQLALDYCHQQVNKQKLAENYSGLSWHDLVGKLKLLQNHLQLLSHPIILRMKEAGGTVAGYVKDLDASCSKPSELLQILHQMTIEGQTPDVVDEFLSAFNHSEWSVVLIYQQALDIILSDLRRQLKDGDSRKYSLSNMVTILNSVKSHDENGGLLVTLDDLRSTLLTYCNEPMTADLKLEILLVIQQTLTLSEEERIKFIFWRTEALLSTITWNKKLKEDDISNEECRIKFFNELLPQCSSIDHVLCLSEIIKAWPRFEQRRRPENEPWCQLISQSLMKYGNEIKRKAITIIKELVAADRCSDEGLNYVHILFVKLASPVDAAKCLLLSHKQALHEKAAAILNLEDESCDDAELFDMILEHHLLSSIVSSPFYPRLVTHILDRHKAGGNEIPNHLRIEVLSSQLTASGLDQEARALVAQYQRLFPQQSRSDYSLSKLTKWFHR